MATSRPAGARGRIERLAGEAGATMLEAIVNVIGISLILAAAWLAGDLWRDWRGGDDDPALEA